MVSSKDILGEFMACTDREVNPYTGWMSIECKKGLWSIEGKNHRLVLCGAMSYFQQYKEDGEYSSIIGGPTVTEVLSRQPTTKLYKP